MPAFESRVYGNLINCFRMKNHAVSQRSAIDPKMVEIFTKEKKSKIRDFTIPLRKMLKMKKILNGMITTVS